MKALSKIVSLILSILILIGTYFYLKFLETNYDFIIGRAAKEQREFAEFVDFYGEIEPNLPDKTINSKTILGIDTNNNDVRDDIDVWINRTAFDQNETKAMRQYAKSGQAFLKLCKDQNLKDIKFVQNKLFKAEKCLASISDYQRKESGFAKEKLKILLYNTSARISCKDYCLKHAESQITSDDSHLHCDFDIQYPDNVVFGITEWKKSTLKK
jgi:hypothetical protein